VLTYLRLGRRSFRFERALAIALAGGGRSPQLVPRQSDRDLGRKLPRQHGAFWFGCRAWFIEYRAFWRHCLLSVRGGLCPPYAWL